MGEEGKRQPRGRRSGAAIEVALRHKKLMIRLAGAAIGTLMILAAGLWWMLESSGVAVIETRGRDGAIRSTHVWYVEPAGELWLEAGTPENAWYLDLAHDPGVFFSAQGRAEHFVAEPDTGPAGHERIRAQMRAKYGIRDVGVAALFDTSSSIAVRMKPAAK